MDSGTAFSTHISTRLRRSTPTHSAYTIRIADRRFVALVTPHPSFARRWVHTTRWLHRRHHRRLIVGLGVQWTPHTRRRGPHLPPPATIQLCVGHRCLVFQLSQANSIPNAIRRFLADPRVTFVGSGNSHDRRMLGFYYGIHVASGCELRGLARMGNASMEDMADRLLGYRGIRKPFHVAMSDWHVDFLSDEQVQYASLDAYLSFRLAVYRAVPRVEHHAAQANWALVAATAAAVDDGGDDAAESEYSSEILDNTRPRVAASDSDIDEDDGLSMINSSSYASDDHVFSSDDFELVGHGLLSSEDEEFIIGMGGLKIDSDINDDNDEVYFNGNTGSSIGVVNVESYNEYSSIGILTVQNCGMGGNEQMFVSNGVATLEELEDDDIVTGPSTVIVNEGGVYDAFEAGNIQASDDVGDWGGYGEDDWYDQDLDQDYGDESLDYDSSGGLY
uniref:3'-5' exonuclease domain-containing protein n=1 Tax=Leersia perrieri TaxID=77586 RepID=A0A0D9WUR9_9ORYZ